MPRLNTSPLDWDSLKNIATAGIERIRIAYSKDIIAQLWQTQVEIATPVLFANENEAWIADWNTGDFESADLTIQEDKTDAGNSENYSFKLTFETGITQADFKKWYDTKLRKQSVCLVINDLNCNESAFNPFEVTYRYVMPASPSEFNKYELTFVRTRIIAPGDDKIIGVKVVCGSNKATTLKFDFLSNLATQYNAGYSLFNNPDSVANWQSGELSFNNVPQGIYFGFAKLKVGDPDLLLSYKFKVECNVCNISFQYWEEIVMCRLSLDSWEEITDYGIEEVELILGQNF